MKFENPTLYILMRTDLDSLTPGKGMAQGAHAANQAVYEIERSKNKTLKAALKQWQAEGKGFGTTIVLDAATEQSLKSVVKDINVPCNMLYAAGLTVDDTYPLRDGSVTHLIPLTTCGWAFFANKEDAYFFLGGLSLHSKGYEK